MFIFTTKNSLCTEADAPLLECTARRNCVQCECFNQLTGARKIYTPQMKCVNLALCVCATSVHEHKSPGERASAEWLNTGKKEKEMPFINLSDDATLPWLYKWQFMCRLCCFRPDVIWNHLHILRGKESTVSHRKFYFRSYLMKYELYLTFSIMIILPALDRDGAAACRAKSLTAGTSSAWDRFMRSAFLETVDQTYQSDYRPIVIGSRSIGAPIKCTFGETLSRLQ